jgi:hypothetical protein
MIFGASDRMVTAGDIEFEPAQTKLWHLTTSMVALNAGEDMAMQMVILQDVQDEIGKQIAAEPAKWLKVRDIAEIYMHAFNRERLRRSSSEILAPLGLDHQSFLLSQQNMDPDLINQLATELINFETPHLETIFAGVDETGPHLYIASDNHISCRDSVGFAAIGAGSGHANSQFMFAKHTKFKPIPETLLLTYSAKKRAEIAPGVGIETDMFTIGPQLGSFAALEPQDTGDLEKIYRKAVKSEERARKRSEKEINAYIQKIIGSSSTKEQTETPEKVLGDSSPGKKELTVGPEVPKAEGAV